MVGHMQKVLWSQYKLTCEASVWWMDYAAVDQVHQDL